MIIRPFEPDDALFCFKVRSEAYIVTFREALAPEIIAECVNAYMPEDYIRMAEAEPVFIGLEKDRPIVFFTLKKLDTHRAELPLIFVKQTHFKRGVGKRCLGFMEGWIAEHWPEVDTFIVDTIIPGYNGEFYQRMGFIPEGETTCHFPNQAVKALRLAKKLSSKKDESNR